MNEVTSRTEWRYRSDNPEKFPWLVLFEDKQNFPASDRYAFEDEAREAINHRAGELYQTRRVIGVEQMKLMPSGRRE